MILSAVNIWEGQSLSARVESKDMKNNIVEVEDTSLNSAEQKLRSQIPDGYLLISKNIISDGKPKSIRCVADTPEAAFMEALSMIPANSSVIDKIVLAKSGKKIVIVKAYNEKEALSIAEKDTPNPLGKNIKTMRVLRLATLGRRGFLFRRSVPNHYEIEVGRQAIVEVKYKTKVRIVGEIGLDMGSLIEAIQKRDQDVYKRRMTTYLTNNGRPASEIAEIISNQLNLDLLSLLKIVLKRCECYKALAHDFVSNYYFSLGPRVSILLSTHFFTEAIEMYHIDHESDIRHLLYLLQPQEASYSQESLDFDKELDVNRQYSEALEKLKSYTEDFSKIKPIEQLKLDPSGWEWDAKILDTFHNEYEASRLLADVEALKQRLESVNVRIELEKKRITEWLKNAILALKQADLKEKNAQTSILNRKRVFKQLNFNFIEVLIALLRENNLLYEASSFCDNVNEVIKNDLSPQRVRATMTRSRAEFLKLAYKKSIQMLGEDKNQSYKVQGPVYLLLQNQIQECTVDFFIVGPTIEQLTSPKACEGNNQLSFEVKPGRYVVVCEPKMSIPPLILEGDCLPGRQYQVGIQLVKQQRQLAPPIHKLGGGIVVDTGLFGAIDIDPLRPLELLFNGRKHQIQNYLGEGSGGIVYQAMDKENGSITAFKFMTTDLLGSNSQIEIGKQEWQIYNSLESKQCVIGISGFSEDLVFIQEEKQKKKKKTIVAYQMEYANQGSLASYLENKQDALSPNEIVAMLKQISIGLGSIHKAELMHRDIRPQNILVFQDNPRYRICDFTLTKSKKDLIFEQLNGVFNETSTKFIDGFAERRATSTLLSLHRVVRSSTFYAAPEEHDERGVIDRRSDIYSVGGILYWLLTGFEPFELILRDQYRGLYERYKLAMEEHILQLDFQHRKELFGNLRQLGSELRNASLHLKQQEPLNIEFVEVQYPGISETLFLHFKGFIAKTIQPDPNNRFQTVLEMQAAINEMEKAV